MTLPARSLPDADTPESPPERELPFPLTFLAVVGVSALVIILCVLGAVVSGGFGLLGGTRAVASATPAFEATLRPPAQQFADGQWVVGLDVREGAYETTVPADSTGCAWEHAKSADGTVNAIIATGTAHAGEKVMVTLARAEEVIRSDDCGTWRRATT